MKKSKLRQIIREEIKKLNEASTSVDFDSRQKKYSNVTISNETLNKGQTFTKCEFRNCVNKGAVCVDCE